MHFRESALQSEPASGLGVAGPDPAGVLRMHVQLAAPPPAEHFAVTGSEEALGNWNPRAGILLQCNGTCWSSSRPVPLMSGSHLEFKFVRLRGDHVDWEEGDNHVLEVPLGSADVELKGSFNGDITTNLAESDMTPAAHSAKMQYEEMRKMLAEQKRKLELRRTAHREAQEHHLAAITQLRLELEQHRRETELLPTAEVADAATVAAAEPPPGAIGGEALGGCRSSSTGSLAEKVRETGCGKHAQQELHRRHATMQAASWTPSTSAPSQVTPVPSNQTDSCPDKEAAQPAGVAQPEPLAPPRQEASRLGAEAQSFEATQRESVAQLEASTLHGQEEPSADEAGALGSVPPSVGLTRENTAEQQIPLDTALPRFETASCAQRTKTRTGCDSVQRKQSPSQGTDGLCASARPRYDRCLLDSVSKVSTAGTSSGMGMEDVYGMLPLEAYSPSVGPRLGGMGGTAMARSFVASREVMAAFETARERYAKLQVTPSGTIVPSVAGTLGQTEPNPGLD